MDAVDILNRLVASRDAEIERLRADLVAERQARYEWQRRATVNDGEVEHLRDLVQRFSAADSWAEIRAVESDARA